MDENCEEFTRRMVGPILMDIMDENYIRFSYRVVYVEWQAWFKGNISEYPLVTDFNGDHKRMEAFSFFVSRKEPMSEKKAVEFTKFLHRYYSFYQNQSM